MSTARLSPAVLERLCAASERGYQNPHRALDWPDALRPDDGWAFAPELSSLAGTEVYAALSEEQRRRLAFWEAVNFFSLNIHGEKALIAGIATRFYGKRHKEQSAYLHYFLDEESKHLVYFTRFCLKYGGKIYPSRQVTWPREYAPGEEDFLFFARALVFEEIVDWYNRAMADDARLHPIVRRINQLHHADEKRHLAFGRAHTARLFEEAAPRWSADTLASVRGYLETFLTMTFREYFCADAYRDAGIDEAAARAAAAFASGAARERRIEASRRCVRHLREAGILEREPNL